MKKCSLGALVIMACLAASGPAASAATPFNETLSLDTYESVSDGAAGPATTAGALASGTMYAVRVTGTWSAYRPGLWTPTAPNPRSGPCGSPEPAPAFTSPFGPGTGKVGQDADTIFAAIEVLPCRNSYPRHYVNFQMDSGTGWVHYEPFGSGAQTTPSADHSYLYLIAGQGAPLSFRQVDVNTTDNYGRYSISVSEGGESCKKDGWKAYGVFKNQGDCVSYFATNGRNQPAGSATNSSSAADVFAGE